jgi:GAF domain-containing protein
MTPVNDRPQHIGRRRIVRRHEIFSQYHFPPVLSRLVDFARHCTDTTDERTICDLACSLAAALTALPRAVIYKEADPGRWRLSGSAGAQFAPPEIRLGPGEAFIYQSGHMLELDDLRPYAEAHPELRGLLDDGAGGACAFAFPENAVRAYLIVFDARRPDLDDEVIGAVALLSYTCALALAASEQRREPRAQRNGNAGRGSRRA